MKDGSLAAQRELWERKRATREVYLDLYRRIASRCVSGRTLELGAGIGKFKEFLPEAISTDIVAAPWLDMVADGESLPFPAASLANIAMIDVLHHLAHPGAFFAEACRVLRPGGRIVLVEPGISPVSGLFYRLLHHERVDMSADPLGAAPMRNPGDPYDGNQAVLSLLVGRHRERFAAAFPALRMVETEWISLVAYPLSGGFRRWSLIPDCALAPTLAAEKRLERLIGRLAGFRLLAVLERR